MGKAFAARGIEDQRVDLSDGDLHGLAEVKLSGRQIKNTFGTTCLMAKRGKEAVEVKHIRTALKVTRRGFT